MHTQFQYNILFVRARQDHSCTYVLPVPTSKARKESDKLIHAEIWKSDENQVRYTSQRHFCLFPGVFIFHMFIDQNQHSTCV